MKIKNYIFSDLWIIFYLVIPVIILLRESNMLEMALFFSFVLIGLGIVMIANKEKVFVKIK